MDSSVYCKILLAFACGENTFCRCFVANEFAHFTDIVLKDDYSYFPAAIKNIKQGYISLVGDRLEGAEAGSWQAALDAAVQSAPAHITMQLGPALFYTLLHGSANKVTCIQMYTHLSAPDVGIELIF